MENIVIGSGYGQAECKLQCTDQPLVILIDDPASVCPVILANKTKLRKIRLSLQNIFSILN